MITGKIQYGFLDALNALRDSVADASAIVSAWKDIADTETARDVHISLGSESSTVPNLAKALQSMQERTGDVRASGVLVNNQADAKSEMTPISVEVATNPSTLRFPSGERRSQHSYQTPWNEVYDVSYLGPGASETLPFFNIPRVVFIAEGTGFEGSSHAVVLQAPSSADARLRGRQDLGRICLCTESTIVNGLSDGQTRTVNVGQYASGVSVQLAPSQYCRLLVWAWADSPTVNVLPVGGTGVTTAYSN